MRSSDNAYPCEVSFSPSQGSLVPGQRTSPLVEPAVLSRPVCQQRKRAGTARSTFHGRSASAFTLLEVMVSIAILGGVIVALLVARSNAQETHLIAAQTMTSARLASSQAALLRGGALGEGEGEFKEPYGYRWRIAAFPADDSRPDLRKYELSVWPESHEAEAAVTLHVWTLDQTAEAAE